MLGKFPQVAELAAHSTKMSAISAALDSANQTYEQAKGSLVDGRVDLKFADFTTDIELKNLVRRVELADSKAGGPIFKLVAPEGKTALVKPFGDSQLQVLVDVHGVLGALVATWPGAAQEQATVGGLRATYKTALTGRDGAREDANKLRVARNIAKEAFITGYLEISFSVKALYPRDKVMQDLFFDDVTNDVDKELDDDSAAEPQTPPPA